MQQDYVLYRPCVFVCMFDRTCRNTQLSMSNVCSFMSVDPYRGQLNNKANTSANAGMGDHHHRPSSTNKQINTKSHTHTLTLTHSCTLKVPIGQKRGQLLHSKTITYKCHQYNPDIKHMPNPLFQPIQATNNSPLHVAPALGHYIC